MPRAPRARGSCFTALRIRVLAGVARGRILVHVHEPVRPDPHMLATLKSPGLGGLGPRTTCMDQDLVIF